MKLSDYVIQFLVDSGINHAFCISGQGNLHLIDSLSKNPNIDYVSNQHEQAVATAAEGYSKTTGNLGAAIVTTGPGGTNTVTGVAGAWLDSVPVIYISGQVNRWEGIRETKVRQFGVQEINIVDIVRPITKYAVTVTDPNTIKYHLSKAKHLASTGRPGPVWLDIPLDVSHKEIDPEQIQSFVPETEKPDTTKLEELVTQTLVLLKTSKRPVILAGGGIKQAHAREEFEKVVKALGIPVLCTYSGAELMDHDDPLFAGRPGINATRYANFTVQNADLLLSIGSRLNTTQTGRKETYAREAKKIVVDIDDKELGKGWIEPDVAINFDAKLFLQELLKQFGKNILDLNPWIGQVKKWKKRYSPVLPEYQKTKEGVNSFVFVDILSDELSGKDIFIHDMGTSFSCTMQTFKAKRGQTVFSNYGLANMGYFLPASIGAWFASEGKKRVVTLCGDGGLQMTIGELQTLAQYKIPLKIFILNNHCYLTIKHSQTLYFDSNYVDSTPESGYSAPDFVKIAKAYGLTAASITSQKELRKKIQQVLETEGPVVCDVLMPDDQHLHPKLSAKVVNGKYVASPLEDMYPHLPREEFLENMIIDPLEEK